MVTAYNTDSNVSFGNPESSQVFIILAGSQKGINKRLPENLLLLNP